MFMDFFKLWCKGERENEFEFEFETSLGEIKGARGNKTENGHASRLPFLADMNTRSTITV